MARHYISIDKDNKIVRTFTDKFNSPKAGDICVNENGGRHFQLNLITFDGIYKYKWDGNKIAERPPEDLASDRLKKEKTIKHFELLDVTLKKLAENDPDYQTKKTKIDAATTIEELEGII